MVIGVVLGLLAWLASCRPPLGSGDSLSMLLDPPGESTETPVELLARRAIPLTPTATLRDTATLTLTPDLTATQLASLVLQSPVMPASETPTETPTAPVGFSICAPVEGILREDLPRLISDGYHPPPRSRPDDRHEGIDIAYYHWKGLGPIAKTPITSVLAGKVAAALQDTFPYGNFAIVETPGEAIPEEIREALSISTGQSLYLLYAHMEESSLEVALGDTIAACQVVGAVGRTGNTQAYHLHLETRVGPSGASFDSMSNFTDQASEDEKRNYRLWRVSGKYEHFDPMLLLLYGLEAPTATPRQSLPPKESN
jgi:murein DD-endopeptidase MepM/ murein hydrolase activator NlpD